jgi:hypothetical protein
MSINYAVGGRFWLAPLVFGRALSIMASQASNSSDTSFLR